MDTHSRPPRPALERETALADPTKRGAPAPARDQVVREAMSPEAARDQVFAEKRGKIGKPVLLKRAFSATLEELLLSAEYILSHGNDRVILCERGIRTFERATRNTLDISAIPILKLEPSLPVIVDLSHALGRRDIVLPCGRASLAAGADGIMVEVHAAPDRALSDGFQQLDLPAYSALVAGLGIAADATKSHSTR